ncbi:hypothetical protein WA158_004634 [Blastocystis sp. Blastoise]
MERETQLATNISKSNDCNLTEGHEQSQNKVSNAKSNVENTNISNIMNDDFKVKVSEEEEKLKSELLKHDYKEEAIQLISIVFRLVHSSALNLELLDNDILDKLDNIMGKDFMKSLRNHKVNHPSSIQQPSNKLAKKKSTLGSSSANHLKGKESNNSNDDEFSSLNSNSTSESFSDFSSSSISSNREESEDNENNEEEEEEEEKEKERKREKDKDILPSILSSSLFTSSPSVSHNQQSRKSSIVFPSNDGHPSLSSSSVQSISSISTNIKDTSVLTTTTSSPLDSTIDKSSKVILPLNTYNIQPIKTSINVHSSFPTILQPNLLSPIHHPANNISSPPSTTFVPIFTSQNQSVAGISPHVSILNKQGTIKRSDYSFVNPIQIDFPQSHYRHSLNYITHTTPYPFSSRFSDLNTRDYERKNSLFSDPPACTISHSNSIDAAINTLAFSQGPSSSSLSLHIQNPYNVSLNSYSNPDSFNIRHTKQCLSLPPPSILDPNMNNSSLLSPNNEIHTQEQVPSTIILNNIKKPSIRPLYFRGNEDQMISQEEEVLEKSNEYKYENKNEYMHEKENDEKNNKKEKEKESEKEYEKEEEEKQNEEKKNNEYNNKNEEKEENRKVSKFQPYYFNDTECVDSICTGSEEKDIDVFPRLEDAKAGISSSDYENLSSGDVVYSQEEDNVNDIISEEHSEVYSQDESISDGDSSDHLYLDLDVNSEYNSPFDIDTDIEDAREIYRENNRNRSIDKDNYRDKDGYIHNDKDRNNDKEESIGFRFIDRNEEIETYSEKRTQPTDNLSSLSPRISPHVVISHPLSSSHSSFSSPSISNPISNSISTELFSPSSSYVSSNQMRDSISSSNKEFSSRVYSPMRHKHSIHRTSSMEKERKGSKSIWNSSKRDQESVEDLHYSPYNKSSFHFHYFLLPIYYIPRVTGVHRHRLHLPPNTYIADKYLVVRGLGKAAFSLTLECIDMTSPDKAHVCLKQSLDEIRLLRYLNARGDPDVTHTPRLLDFFYYSQHLVIVMELLQSNLYRLQHVVKSRHLPPYFTLDRIQTIAEQCLKALEFIHQSGIIHCDLKPENILIQDYESATIKIVDYGGSNFAKSYNFSIYIQSRAYRAPEVLLALPYDQRVDIWSVGCLLCELYSGFVLFDSTSRQDLMRKFVKLLGFPPLSMIRISGYGRIFFPSLPIYTGNPSPAPDTYSPPTMDVLKERLGNTIHCDDDQFLDFILTLLTWDPKERVTASQALQHPFIQEKRNTNKYDASLLNSVIEHNHKHSTSAHDQSSHDKNNNPSIENQMSEEFTDTGD